MRADTAFGQLRLPNSRLTCGWENVNDWRVTRKNKRRSRIHARIRELREERGLSPTELGRLVGADKTAVWHWENGDYAPSRARMPLVADALGVTIDELYAEAA